MRKLYTPVRQSTEHSQAVRLLSNYATAREEVEKLETEFAELEEALEQSHRGSTAWYKEQYRIRGGDQFRPDPSKVKCEYSRAFSDV